MRKANKKVTVRNQPMRLTKQEQEDPLSVLDTFFDTYHLNEVREVLWEWVTAGLTNDQGAYTTARSRSNLLFLYEHVESLTEAAYLILQNRKGVRKNIVK